MCQVSVGSLEKQPSGVRKGFQRVTCQQEQRQTAKMKLFSRTSVWAAIGKCCPQFKMGLSTSDNEVEANLPLSAQCSAMNFFPVLVSDTQAWPSQCLLTPTHSVC